MIHVYRGFGAKEFISGLIFKFGVVTTTQVVKSVKFRGGQELVMACPNGFYIRWDILYV